MLRISLLSYWKYPASVLFLSHPDTSSRLKEKALFKNSWDDTHFQQRLKRSVSMVTVSSTALATLCFPLIEIYTVVKYSKNEFAKM